ncbi:hypothetical protein [Knoellia subterranea]|uniref:Uncharacterized protein n=1 Tax=Knoellia subterranea KCTC 19937 TaxID=1385521 RepID=A0A0A0JMJ5_9MICO|nr:hypothetical protein [Knoellia subterranea]KGN37949.1 hypothetical protein N803_12875 [Knoellia subterranea KCTC 19937]
MTEHLLLFPDREVAEEIAQELDDEGFAEVRVLRVAHAGEDDSEDHEWAVHVVEEAVGTSGEAEGGQAEGGLRGRFAALAAEHDGWYDPDPTGSSR